MIVSKQLMRTRTIAVRPFDLIVFVTSLLSSLGFLIFNTTPSNTIMFILPVIYGFGYIFVISPALRMLNCKTTIMFAICEALRMVMLVFITGITNQYGFNAFKTEDTLLLSTATFLIAYEYIVICFLILIYSSNHRGSIEQKSNSIDINTGEIIGLILIILSAGVLYIGFPVIRSQINFLKLDAAAEKVRSVSTGTYSSIIVLVLNYVHYAYLCIFIFVVNWMAKKYKKKKSIIYYYFSLGMGLITIATIFGESRSTLVYTAFAVFTCMSVLFPYYRKKTFRWVIIGMILVFLGMTVYRLFLVYQYSSYFDAISAGPRVRNDYYANFMESYLLGPQSVAAGIKLANIQASKFNIFSLFFDIFRPIMGFNLLLKNINMDTSITLFNSMLYGELGRSNGYFLQITAQGYCYFGFLFAPVFLSVFMLMGYKLEKKISDTKSLFSFFFLNYIHIRISTAMLGGTMSGFITSTSMLMLIMLFFIIVQKFTNDTFKRK